MANYSLGRIVPEKLIPIFESSFPDSCREITSIMYRIFPGFQEWEYLGNISSGLMIECKGKPTKRQLEALFDAVEEILPKYPVLDLSDTISYEDYIALIKSKDNDWMFGDGYDFIKSHQKHNERSFVELIRENRKNREMAE
jgi:hypothetical protein